MYNVYLNGFWWESSLKVKSTQKVYNIIDSQWPGDGIYKPMGSPPLASIYVE